MPWTVGGELGHHRGRLRARGRYPSAHDDAGLRMTIRGSYGLTWAGVEFANQVIYGIYGIWPVTMIRIYLCRYETLSPCLEDGMEYFATRLGSLKSWMLSLSVVAAMVASTGVPRAFAQSEAEIEERCQRRVGHAEHELHEAIERHGRHSRQANHERRELRAAREQCWREHHRWWDEHERRWHNERDLDDRDHDRD